MQEQEQSSTTTDGSVIITSGASIRGDPHRRIQLMTMDGKHVIYAPASSGGSNSVWLSSVAPPSRSTRSSNGSRGYHYESARSDGRAHYPVTVMHNGDYFQHFLRPQPVDLPEHLFEDVSLSSVSTMTASRAMESTYNPNRHGNRITQLQDSHRVSHHTPLKSLVNLADIAAGSVSSQSRSSSSVVSHAKDLKTEVVPDEEKKDDDTPPPLLGYSSKVNVSQFDAGGYTT